MRRNSVLLSAAFVLGVGVVAGCLIFLVAIGNATRIHQQSITAELANWAQEYAAIRDPDHAYRAIAMLQYIQRYYVVADGYRSDPETERALEKQRDKTMLAICSALDAYCESEADDAAEKIRTAKLKALAGSRWEAKPAIR